MIKVHRLMLKLFVIIFAFAYTNAQVIVVNSNLDDPAVDVTIGAATAGGVITLRSAIEFANHLGGANTINFDIAGTGPFTIDVGTGTGVTGEPLPEITSSLTIDGYSQPGTTVATCSSCTPITLLPATIFIVLNGSNVDSGAITLQNGLTLIAGSASSVIQGLVIQGFPNDGIAILGDSNQKIAGNFIGLNQAGTSAVPNGGNGITISALATGVTVGSIVTADKNVISGQDALNRPFTGNGILIEGSGNQIVNNFIGTDLTGANSIPNRTGVYVLNTTTTSASNNIIKCNTIQNNNGSGALEGFGVVIDGAQNNPILSNSIFANAKSGILLNDNGNANLPAPTLTSAVASGSTIKVNGSYSSPANPNSIFRIEFFVNPTSRTDITEGKTFVGEVTLTTDGSGNASFTNIRLPSTANPGQFVSATATLLNAVDTAVDTSAYSTDIVLGTGTSEGTLSVAIYSKYCNRNDLPCCPTSATSV